jgi:hypothetical protein
LIFLLYYLDYYSFFAFTFTFPLPLRALAVGNEESLTGPHVSKCCATGLGNGAVRVFTFQSSDAQPGIPEHSVTELFLADTGSAPFHGTPHGCPLELG